MQKGLRRSIWQSVLGHTERRKDKWSIVRLGKVLFKCTVLAMYCCISTDGLSQEQLQARAQAQVHFLVDMRGMKNLAEIAELDVAIRGNIAPLSWSKSTFFLQDKNKDGVYETTISFKHGLEADLEFKFVTAGGRIWEQGDAHSVQLNINRAQTYKTSFKHSPHLENPFKKFIGDWRYDDSGFSIVWNGGPLQVTKNSNQVSRCRQINHDRSLLCEVTDPDDPFLRGQMLWTYNQTTKEVSWLSHFFPERNGVGKGKIDEHGNLTAKVEFENEPQGTYRVYQWRWINPNSYSMISHQYKTDGTPTGDWYGGTSVRR